jgi:tetratricopeptide (TPR) repeat protein
MSKTCRGKIKMEAFVMLQQFFRTITLSTALLVIFTSAELFPAIAKGIEIHNLMLAQSQSAESLYQQGIARFKRKDYRGGISDLTEAIRLNPNYAQAYFDRGLMFSFLEEYRAGIRDLTESIRLEPRHAEAYFGRGMSYTQLGAHKKAIPDFAEAIRLKPNYTDAYYARGVSLRLLGFYRESIADFTKAIHLKPDHAMAFYDRAIAKGYLENYQGAIDDGETASRFFKKEGNQQAYTASINYVKNLMIVVKEPRQRPSVNDGDEEIWCNLLRYYDNSPPVYERIRLTRRSCLNSSGTESR